MKETGKSEPKNIHDFLDDTQTDLQFILNKSHYLQTLHAQIIPYVKPVELQRYCQVANIDKNKLVLIAANSSVATQLRFQINVLLNQFKTHKQLHFIKEIQIKLHVFTAFTSSQQINQKMSLLSENTAKLISTTAQSIQDPTVRKIMERIATRVKTKDNSE